MRFVGILLGFMGLFFIASAATENGLLPSGHGVGRVGEAILGVALVVYGTFRITHSRSRG